jgi:hypothetical protein
MTYLLAEWFSSIHIYCSYCVWSTGTMYTYTKLQNIMSLILVRICVLFGMNNSIILCEWKRMQHDSDLGMRRDQHTCHEDDDDQRMHQTIDVRGERVDLRK